MTKERLQFFKDVAEADTVIRSELVKELVNEIESLGQILALISGDRVPTPTPKDRAGVHSV